MVPTEPRGSRETISFLDLSLFWVFIFLTEKLVHHES